MNYLEHRPEWSADSQGSQSVDPVITGPALANNFLLFLIMMITGVDHGRDLDGPGSFLACRAQAGDSMALLSLESHRFINAGGMVVLIGDHHQRSDTEVPQCTPRHFVDECSANALPAEFRLCRDILEAGDCPFLKEAQVTDQPGADESPVPVTPPACSNARRASSHFVLNIV